MIATFKHKALRRYFETGDSRGLNSQYIEKIGLVLGVMNAADSIAGMDLPSFRLHALAGDLKGYWSITVRANWRIIFRFEDGYAIDVDLVDYH